MNQVATLPKRSLVNSMAARYDMEPNAFVEAIKASVIKGACSNEQFAAFLMVAKEYDLNPLTKEIYAFPDRGGIQPIVSIDGWMKLINSHPQFDGMEFDDTHEDGKLSSVTCRMYRKDRSRPISVIEYMTECARPTEPWKKWPARMLRHKAAIQAARYAFGFSGIMEPDEYDRMKDVTPAPVQTVADPFGDEPQSGEGFSKDFVTSETETLASGSNNEEQDTPADVASSGSVEGGERSVLSGSTLINSDEEQAELTGNQHDDSEVVPDYEQRRECLDKFMAITKDNSISIQQRRGTLEQAKDYWKADLPHDLDFVRFAFNEADRVIKGERTEEEARENLSSFIEVA